MFLTVALCGRRSVQKIQNGPWCPLSDFGDPFWDREMWDPGTFDDQNGPTSSERECCLCRLPCLSVIFQLPMPAAAICSMAGTDLSRGESACKLLCFETNEALVHGLGVMSR